MFVNEEARDTVLLVDDDRNFVQALSDILSAEGYPVASARNGEQALQYLQQHPPPALILLNLAMPVMNGWAFVAELQQRAELAEIPVVLLSGLADVPQQAVSLNTAGYLSKPVDVELLLETVRRFCSRRGARDA